jgi:hypothetical protein
MADWWVYVMAAPLGPQRAVMMGSKLVALKEHLKVVT